MQSKDAYRLYGLFPKNDNSSSSYVVRIALCGVSFGPKIIVIWAELSVTWREHKLSFYFIIWTVFNSIRDKYVPPEGPHSWHWKIFTTLFVRHLESLGLLETQHSNQNTHSHWLKREFRDITDVLIYWDIPDW